MLLGIGTAISLLGDATLYTVLPDPTIASQVGITLTMVGFLLGVNRAIRLVLNSPVGLLYDRLPRRGLLVTSLFLGALSSVIYAVGTGFWPLLIGRISWGVAWSLLWIGGNAVILDISTDENRGRYSGQYQMWFFSGVAASSFLGGLFTDLFGFRGGLWVSAGLIGAAALLWLFFLPETRPAGIAPESQKTEEDNPGGMFPWRISLTASVPLFMMRFVFAGVLAATSILWLSQYFDAGMSLFNRLVPLATLTGGIVALRTVVSIISASLAGRISDRVGRRWVVIAVSTLIGGIGVWLMSADLFLLSIIGAFTAAVTGGSVQSLVPAIAGDQVDDAQRGRALGIIFTIGDLGSTLGPPVALSLLNAKLMTLTTLYRGCAILFGAVALQAFTQIRSEPPITKCTD